MIRSIEQLDIGQKRLFIRVDFNVPLDKKTGKVKDDARVQAALPTIRYAVGKKAKVILASHLGRPDGKVVPEMSLEPAGARLSQLLGQDVIFADDCVGDGVKKLVGELRDGQVLLLENLRFHPEEEANDDAFARELAALCDVYVDDAFGTMHRAHASTVGMVKHVPQRGAGSTGRGSSAPRPSSGTVRWASSRFRNSRRARGPSPRRWRRRRSGAPGRWSAGGIRPPRSPKWGSRTRSRTSPRAAAPRSSSSKGASFPGSRCWTNDASPLHLRKLEDAQDLRRGGAARAGAAG